MFPQDPIRNAPQIISNLNSVFPPAAGHHLFGPMVQIAWGTPPLITADVGVVLELGARLRLLILAQIAAILPRRDNELVRLQMDAIGIARLRSGHRCRSMPPPRFAPAEEVRAHGRHGHAPEVGRVAPLRARSSVVCIPLFNRHLTSPSWNGSPSISPPVTTRGCAVNPTSRSPPTRCSLARALNSMPRRQVLAFTATSVTTC